MSAYIVRRNLLDWVEQADPFRSLAKSRHVVQLPVYLRQDLHQNGVSGTYILIISPKCSWGYGRLTLLSVDQPTAVNSVWLPSPLPRHASSSCRSKRAPASF